MRRFARCFCFCYECPIAAKTIVKYTKAMAQDENYMAVLLEEIRDQNKAVLEAVSDMQKQVAYIPEMRDDIKELKSDMKVVKAAISDVSNELEDHEHRISHLEAAVA